jgi:tetratricopeptide (TPR) repeat protein
MNNVGCCFFTARDDHHESRCDTLKTEEGEVMSANRMMGSRTTGMEPGMKLPRAATLNLLALSIAFSVSAHAGTVPDEAVKDAEAGYFHKALAIVEPLAKDHPQDAELQFRYGQALAGTGKADDGIAALKAAIALDPKNGVYHRVLGETYEANFQQVSVFRMFGFAKSLQAEFQSAVQLAPSDVQSHVDLANFYINAPSAFGGSFDKAHAEEDIIGKLDKVAELQVRANEAGEKDDIASGEALLKQAIVLDKTSASRIALGLFYTQAKRYDDALQAFRDAEAADPKAYEAWYQIGRVAGFADASHYAEGIESFKHYLAVDDLPDTIPSIAWAHYRLGNIYEHQGHKDLARTEYQTAAGLEGNDQQLASELKKATSRLD